MVDDGASSLQRAIAILVALGSDAVTQRDSVGVIDIARLVGREKSQVSRALKTLADAGLVDRDPETLGYRLGWRLFTLAACAADQHLLAIAPRILRELVGVVGERAHLSVLEGPEALTVLSESPARAIIQAVSWVGRPTPLHSTSSGRALLFDHTDEEVRGLLAEAEFRVTAPNAPRDVEDLLARLHRARHSGYAVADEEFEAGLVAVAAPVRDFRGRVVAALNISAPKFRLGHNLDTAGLHVKAAAAHLSCALIRPLPAEQTHSA
jgi:IclR family KDG regulon transcriptional repressor